MNSSPRPGQYRLCVGLCIFNGEGKVFVGERIDTPGGWQMPQGGIDEGEDVERAAFREMKEEIGTDKAAILRIHPDRLRYDIPDEVLARLPWGNIYGGQEQIWIAMRFTGADSDIALDADDHPEFARYQWVDLPEVVKFIVPFKITTYEQVVKIFADIPAQIK
ncbi:MAG: RNA pyrophosphohydrolase [Micavibrio sp.]